MLRRHHQPWFPLGVGHRPPDLPTVSPPLLRPALLLTLGPHHYLTGFCLIALYYGRAPPYRGRDISLPGGRPPVNVLRKGGRSPNEVLRRFSKADLRLISMDSAPYWSVGRKSHNFERQIRAHENRPRGQQSCPPQGPILTQEGPAVRLYRLESDESSLRAPKAR